MINNINRKIRQLAIYYARRSDSNISASNLRSRADELFGNPDIADEIWSRETLAGDPDKLPSKEEELQAMNAFINFFIEAYTDESLRIPLPVKGFCPGWQKLIKKANKQSLSITIPNQGTQALHLFKALNAYNFQREALEDCADEIITYGLNLDNNGFDQPPPPLVKAEYNGQPIPEGLQLLAFTGVSEVNSENYQYITSALFINREGSIFQWQYETFLIDIKPLTKIETLSKWISSQPKKKKPAKPIPRMERLYTDLANAKVAKQRIETLRELAEDNYLYPGAPGENDFCDLIEYFYGLRDIPPENTDALNVISSYQWGDLFQKILDWDDFDLRLCAWILNIETERKWVFLVVQSCIYKYPKKDIYGIFLQHMEALKIIVSLEDALGKWNIPLVTNEGEVTSFGRYIAPLNFQQVLPIIQKKDRTISYSLFLLRTSPDIFHANFNLFQKEVVEGKNEIVEFSYHLLQVDKQRYEDSIIKWAEHFLKSPYDKCYMIIYICFAYGKKYQDLIFNSTQQAFIEMGEKDGTCDLLIRRYPELGAYSKAPNTRLKVSVVAIVLKTFGKDALPIIKAYDYRNKGWFIDYYETIGKHLPGDTDALAVLIPGLLRELPETLGGLLTYEKYMQRFAEILKTYDLSAYHKQITERFKNELSKKIKKIIDEILS